MYKSEIRVVGTSIFKRIGRSTYESGRSYEFRVVTYNKEGIPSSVTHPVPLPSTKLMSDHVIFDDDGNEELDPTQLPYKERTEQWVKNIRAKINEECDNILIALSKPVLIYPDDFAVYYDKENFMANMKEEGYEDCIDTIPDFDWEGYYG